MVLTSVDLTHHQNLVFYIFMTVGRVYKKFKGMLFLTHLCTNLNVTIVVFLFLQKPKMATNMPVKLVLRGTSNISLNER